VKKVRDMIKEGTVDYQSLNSSFVQDMESEIAAIVNGEGEGKGQRSQKEAADEVKNKLDEFVDRYGNLIDLTAPDITSRIKTRHGQRRRYQSPGRGRNGRSGLPLP